jgi:general secretion pathway protein D
VTFGVGAGTAKLTAFPQICRLLACWLCLALAGCASNVGASLENPGNIDLSAKGPTRVGSRGQSAADTKAGKTSYQLFQGTPQSLMEGSLEPPPGVVAAEGNYTINVDRAEIGEVAKLILGETLGLTYVLDPRVQGTVTLSTSRPLTGPEVLDAFEAALRVNGAGLVKDGNITKIVALQELLEGEMGSADLDPEKVSAGYGVSAIPIRYIGISNMLELIDSFVARSGSVRASNVGNLILVRGAASERRSLIDVVLSFDVDWMRSQTASLAILANSSPDDMVSKLEAIFEQDSATSGNNAIKVVPLERLNGVVVIANSQEKVRRALVWVGRLDKASMTDTNYFVYAVQNGNAEDIAKILVSTFVDKSDAPGLTAEVAPDEATVQLSTEASPDQSQPAAGQANQNGKADLQGTDAVSSLPDNAKDQAEPSLAPGIRITPNVANNTIVIRASQKEYSKILSMLRRIDSPAVQVLINTTIAEVSLNDNLRYGVQAYFRDNKASGGVFNGDSLLLKPSFPGLNFLLGNTSDPKLVLDALAAVTNVRIVSSPSLLVLENETATIKVGDQVPIKIQTLEKDAGGSVDSFEYRDTGVILKVKPRVNSSGLVTMELGQELSSVTAGSGSSTTESENPTFSQRSITSKVSVYSTQTVVLGGLISGQDSREKNGVPGVNKIPLLGGLIGKTDNSSKRNELIVFITPQVVQDSEDASRVSEELRAKMKLFNLN